MVIGQVLDGEDLGGFGEWHFYKVYVVEKLRKYDRQSEADVQIMVHPVILVPSRIDGWE